MYDELALERLVKDQFGLSVDVQSVILPRASVSRTASASVFLTSKKQLMAYIEASSPLLLADVKKLISRMGLKAELYVPPRGQPQYFDEVATEKFHQVFPGMKIVSSEDLIYYRTLAPYNPALVIISEVKRGEIYQFDPDSRGEWRVGARFHYRRILTS
ncbi:MAG: hypothetical protein Q4F02_03405 [Candidatus Saccharibacteria bacterium]|nr:hypothetical protein [Candidatus Saccharibacteria bacterium]